MFYDELIICIGDDGMTEYEWRTNKPSKAKGQVESAVERKISDDLKKFFKIYFPTQETVARSRGGIQVRISTPNPPK